MDSQLANKEAIPRFKVPKSALSSGTGKQRNKEIDYKNEPRTAVVQTNDTGTTSREVLNDRAQQLIDKLNEKRKKDATILADFKKSLEDQAANAYSTVEQRMVQMYERHSKIVQEKVQELFAILDRIAKQEEELCRFRSALGMLYSDVREP
ncbi:synaptonemal complex central element protein 2-like [Corticium candelabrum]|uniref:synaptonemal complex central element protein 2-like n=1 Tax=Corticium candelabrum TaxID=121492 RepID=UPI002E25D069|nr:synaptonemal complex central element protein 2-like [Corticium candelabrum]